MSLGKAFTISRISIHLIRTHVNADRHLFLALSTNTHKKPTSLMWTLTLYYQLCAVIDLSFLKAKNRSVDSMLMFTGLPYTDN